MTSICGKLLPCAALLFLIGCTDGGKTGGKFGTLPPNDVSKSLLTGGDKIITMPSGIKYEDVKVGTGLRAGRGWQNDSRALHLLYAGWHRGR